MANFPTDWQTADIFVAHPDDAEYGISAAVAKWTDAGKTVRYRLGSSGEAGIEGMSAEEAGPLREREEREAAAEVGVFDVEFLGFADSRLENTADLRATVARTVTADRPDMVIVMYYGKEFGPDAPNQRDHIQFGEAVVQTLAELPAVQRPALVLESAGGGDIVEELDEAHYERGVASLVRHDRYFSVIDPDTPVPDQARGILAMVTGRKENPSGPARVAFRKVDLDRPIATGWRD